MALFRWLRHLLVTKAGLACLIVAMLASAGLAEPSEIRLPFMATRNDKQIGPHTISIIRDGETTTVNISSLFVVKVAFVTLYRFEHQSTEVWHNGKFWSLQAKSNDNGTHYTFAGHSVNGKFIVDGFKDKHPVHEELPDLPSAGLWSIEMAHGGEMLNTLTGLPIKVQIKDLGNETVMAHGAPVSARHFQITGELVQDDWYDKDGYMVRKIAKGPDGSDIIFNLL